jgi:Ca2+-transporting ATPase
MSRPPRPPSSKLLDQASLRFIAISGASKAAGGIAVLAVMPRFGFSLDETRTALFLYESALQLVFAYPCRRISVIPMPNIGLHLAIGLGVGLQVLTVLLAPLRTLLGLVPITAGVLGAVLLMVLVTWAIAEFLGHVAPGSRQAQSQG